MRRLVWTLVVAEVLVLVSCCAPNLPDDLPGLVQHMASNDEEVQACAARKTYERYGVDGLLNALQSPLTGARFNAALFLRLHPDPKAREPLLRASHDSDPWVRGQATYALSSFPSPEVEARVKELLSDANATVRVQAQESLDIMAGKAR